MSDQLKILDNMPLTHRPLVAPRWWIFAFIVSLIIFLSALLLLGGEAHAKSGGGGGGDNVISPDSGSGGGNGGSKLADGGGPAKGSDSAKGGGGDGHIGELNSGGGDSAKGSEGPRGGDSPNNNLASSDGKASKDVGSDVTGSLRDAAKNDAIPSGEGTHSDTEKNSAEKNFEPVSGTSGTVERVAKTAEPVIEDRVKAVEPGVESVAKSAEPLMEEASPLVKPAKEATDPVVTPIKETVAPISEAARPVLSPVTKEASEILEPTVVPVREAVAPVLGPVGEPIGEVVEPVADLAAPAVPGLFDGTASPVMNSILEPLGQPLKPMFTPATDAPPATAVAPMTGVAEPLLEPLGPVLDSLPVGGVVPPGMQQSLSLPPVEGPTYQTALPAPPATAASTPLDPGSVVPAVKDGNLGGSTSDATANLSSSYPEQEVVLSLFNEGLASLSMTGMKGDQNQVPQPFPTDTMPVGAGSFSGGSSSSGGILEMSLLGLLVVLLAGGKFVWSARDFLKPNAALLLAIERPG